MPETSPPQPDLTLEEYIELERDAPTRHDLIAGARFPVAETSARHDRIVDTIFRKVADDAEDTEYRVLRNTARLLTPVGSVYYPDVMVVPRSGTENAPIHDDPCLIVEVVSPETDPIDRREKWMAYHTIPTLKAYLMVDQDRPRVDRAFRLSGGEWLFAAEVDDGGFRLPCPPGAELYLAQIYQGLE